MDYTCLQDIFDEIYEADYDGQWAIGREDELPWREGFQKFVTKKGLLEALAYYFKIWDQGERGIAWQQERRGFKEYERASWCFYYAFETTPMLKDPSIIPELMQYFLPEGRDRGPWIMEDVWTEMMWQAVANYHDYGFDYIPWLMKSFKFLKKGSEWLAEEVMFTMIFDTFEHITPDVFPDLSVVDSLVLGNATLLKKILEQDVLEWKELIEKKQEKIGHLVDEREKKVLKEDLFRYEGSLARTEYVLGQLLELPENVVSLHDTP